MKKSLTLLVAIVAFFTTTNAQVLFSEDFESGAVTGWTQVTNATDGGWLIGTNLSSTYWSIPAHSTYAATNDDACNCDKSNEYFITPSIDLSSVSSVELGFNAIFSNYTAESATVNVSTDSGQTWTALLALPSTSTWNGYTIDLTAYAGNSNVMIGFKYNDGGNWGSGYAIDDVKVYVVNPFEAGVDDIYSSVQDGCNMGASETVTVDFINNGTDPISTIDLTISMNGGAPITETYSPSPAIAPSDSASYTFTATFDVSSDGTYEFIAILGLSGDLDSSNDTIGFELINYAPVATPYTQNFDGLTVVDDQDLLYTSESGGYAWAINSGSTLSASTGPNAGFGGSGAYIYTEASGADSLSIAEIKSHCIDLNGLATPAIEFYYHMYGASIGGLWVDVSSDGVNYTTLDSLIGQQQSSESDPWIKKQVDLSSYLNQVIYFRFVALLGEDTATGWSFYGDIAIDELSVIDALADDLKVTDVMLSAQSCDLSATETVKATIYNNGSNNATTFDISYSVNGGTAVTETFNGYLLSNEDTTYEFTTKADLSADGTYDVSVTVSLSGDMDNTNDSDESSTINLAPADLSSSNVSLGFELADTNELSKWTIEDANADGSTWSWFVDTTGYAHSGEYFYGYSWSSANAADDWFISSCIDMKVGASYELSVAAKRASMTYPEKLYVMLGTDNNGASMSDTLIDASSIDTSWVTFVDTFEVSADGSYFVGFKAASDADMFRLFIDDINIVQLVGAGVSDSKLNNVSIYPNPATDHFVINLNNDNTEIRILSATGQLIFSDISKGEVLISTSNWAKGIYFISLNNEEGTFQQKIVVE